MEYSIFKNTLVDMTAPEIEAAIAKGACALLPLSVVEEHGPHLCAGTDIYLTQHVCEKIKGYLDQKEIPALIAPPFYFGINSITDGFTGSLVVSPRLMEELILELLANLKRWGVKDVFLFNFYGDFRQIKKIAEIAEKAEAAVGIKAYFVNAEGTFCQFGIDPNTPGLLPVSFVPPVGGPKGLDIHAGSLETSWMLLNYPDLVDEKVARGLSPVGFDLERLKKWLRGGKTAKNLTPQGYLGSPGDIDLEWIEKFEKRVIESFGNAVEKQLQVSQNM